MPSCGLGPLLAGDRVKMTILLEETIETLNRKEALRVLDAVNGTLEALRQDAEDLGHTSEMTQMVSRIEAYMGHLRRQRQRLEDLPP